MASHTTSASSSSMRPPLPSPPSRNRKGEAPTGRRSIFPFRKVGAIPPPPPPTAPPMTEKSDRDPLSSNTQHIESVLTPRASSGRSLLSASSPTKGHSSPTPQPHPHFLLPSTPNTRKACLSPHFHPVNEYTTPLFLTTPTFLPAIPKPLQKSPSGAYPLVEAKPVLRNSSTKRERHLSFESSMSKSVTKNDAISSARFNLTHSIRSSTSTSPLIPAITTTAGSTTPPNDTESETSFDSTSQETSSSSHANVNTTTTTTTTTTATTVVTFDPRIIITEFNDTDDRCSNHRGVSWYSEYELLDMKQETIERARQYLQEHPEDLVRYNESYLDPVLQRPRQRALFSLPGLSHEAEEDETTTASEDTTPPSRIRRVLIVDPNETILDLLTRSIKMMLSSKKGQLAIERATTGEQAVELLTKSSFDMIVCEHRLSKKSHSLLKTLSESESHSASTTPTNNHQQRHAKTHSWHGFFSNQIPHSVPPPPSIGMTGANVLEAARDLAPTSVLVGITAHLWEDQELLYEHGADFVWGKPPPRMTSMLRSQLEERLEEKRPENQKDAEL